MRFLFIWLLIFGYNIGSYAGDLDISYKPPIVPFEISFGDNGIKVGATKEILTPLGSFKIGYSEFTSELEDDYTYVIIEDLSQRKEHIYKVRDKQRLSLLSESRTNVEITKGRVKIILEENSDFKLSFKIEEQNYIEHGIISSSIETVTSKVNGLTTTVTSWVNSMNLSTFVTPSKEICIKNGGTMNNGYCSANFKNANIICQAIGRKLPHVRHLKEVVTNCGGEPNGNRTDNRNNNSYQNCYEKEGFENTYTWSSDQVVLDFSDGESSKTSSDGIYSFQCIRQRGKIF